MPEDPILPWLSPRLTGLRNAEVSHLDSSYYKYLGDRGVHVYEDINRQRAMEQSGWAMTGKALWNIVPETVGGLVEMVGTLGSLVTEWGDDRDYTNDVTRAGQWIKNTLGAEIYAKNPGAETFDFGDLASYLNTGSSLVGSMASFALGGAGVAKLAATGLAGLRSITASRALLAGARGFAHTATASTLAYAEGALSGAQVFTKTYDNWYKQLALQGMSHEEADQKARHIASQAASSTVQLNTILNTGLNMTALAPFFKSTDEAILGEVRRQTMRRAGESMDDWYKRISDLNYDQTDLARTFRRQGMYALKMEAIQEGVEELNNQFAEYTGIALGEKDEKGQKGFFGQLGELSKWFDRTMNAEGALNFTLGMVGGIGQTVALDSLPIHRTASRDNSGNIVEENGQAVYQWVSSRSLGNDGHRKFFTNVKDAIAKDVEYTKNKLDDIESMTAAGKKTEADQARHELLSVPITNSILLGMPDIMVNTFEELAAVDNKTPLREKIQPVLETEQDPARKAELQEKLDKFGDQTDAMARGLTTSVEDNSYVQKAKEAVQTLKRYQQIYDRTRKEFHGLDERGEVADYIFNRRVQLDIQERIMRNFSTEVSTFEAETKKEDADVDPLLRSLKSYRESIDTVEAVQADLEEQKKALLSGDKKKMRRLLSKYRVNEDDLPEATNEIIKGINRRQTELNRRRTDLWALFTDVSGMNAWKEKNPDKEDKDFVAEIDKRMNYAWRAKQLAAMKATLGEIQSSVEATRAGIEKLSKGPGLTRLVKDFDNKFKERTRKAAEQMNAKSGTDEEKANSDARYQEYLAETGKQQYDKAVQRVKEATIKLVALEDKLGVINRGLATAIRSKTISFYTEQKELVTTAIEVAKLDLARNQKIADDLLPVPGTTEVSPVDEDVTETSGVDAMLAELQTNLPDIIEPGEIVPSAEGLLGEHYELFTDHVERRTRALLQTQSLSPNDVNAIVLEFIALVNSMPGENMVISPEQITEFLMPRAMEIASAARPKSFQDRYRELLDKYDKNIAVISALTESTEKAVQGTVSTKAIDTLKIPIQEKMEIIAVLNGYLPSLVRLGVATDETSDLRPSELIESLSPETLYEELGQVAKALTPQQFGMLVRNPGRRLSMLEGLFGGDPTKAVIPIMGGIPSKSGEYKLYSIDALSDATAPTVIVDGDKFYQYEGKPGLGIDSSNHIIVRVENGELFLPEDKFPEPENLLIPADFPNGYVSFMNDGSMEELSDLMHAGRKTVDAFKINTNTLAYEEILREDGSYDIVTKHKLDGTFNPDILNPTKLGAGVKVQLVIDTDYDGKQNYDYELSKNKKVINFTHFTDTNGKIQLTNYHIGNVPVKIMVYGKTVGYLPRTDWISAQYPGTSGPEGYRNIVSEIETETSKINNLQVQLDRVMEIRKQLVSEWNSGLDTGIESSIKTKGPGSIITNVKIEPGRKNSRTVADWSSKMLPDQSLRMGIILQGTVYDSKGNPIEVENIDNLQDFLNVPVVLLPMANGKLAASVLNPRTLNQEEDINTILYAIQLFRKSQQFGEAQLTSLEQKHIERIRADLGVDILSPQGLRALIEQYFTYTESFDAATTLISSQSTGSKAQRFLFNVTDTGAIMIGTAFSNKPILYADIDPGTMQLDEAFVNALSDGLAGRRKSVRFTDTKARGINSPGAFKYPVYRAGKLVIREATDYNDYVKQFTKTTVYGKLQLEGKYVYAANPSITLEYPGGEPAVQYVAPITEQTAPPETENVQATQEPFSAAPDSELAEMLGVKHFMEIPGLPLTSRNLYMITEGKGDGTTIRDMEQEGIRVLPDGFNPTDKC